MTRKPVHKKAWTESELRSVATIRFSGVDKVRRTGECSVKLCNYTDVYYRDYIDKTVPFSLGTATKQERNAFKLQAGDVLITKDSESSKDIGIPALVTEDLDSVVCGYHLALLRPIPKKLDGAYLNQALRAHRVRHYLYRESNGITRFGLGLSAVGRIPILLPPIAEQRRIARLLRNWDDAITKVERNIIARKALRLGLVEQLVTGTKRLEKFKRAAWRSARIGTLLNECNRYVDWSDNAAYRFASIRRRSGGLFDRGRFYGREVKTKVLKLLKTNDFVISKRQVVHGAWGLVTKQFNGFGVSDEYDVLVNRDPAVLDIRFFSYLAQTRRMWHVAYRASNGVHIEKLIFNFSDFAKEPIQIPASVEEQGKISDVLEACDREIDLLQKKLHLLKEQKQGLMQKLLSGQIRLNVSRNN
jgi:type I restriction enzyme, S subunit